VLTTLFFVPSTRTHLSAETVRRRLGGNVIGSSSSESTTLAKGETLADPIRVADQHAYLTAMRRAGIHGAPISFVLTGRPGDQ